MTIFSQNLKRLRIEKHLTQEQTADLLGVSAQSVSRWECGTTLPDVMLLPKIAEVYCVTIDDLYKETSTAYDNYAQRLGSIYEATLEPEDFVRANQEYKKLLSSGDYSMEDLRLYGILHQHMMDYCIKQALALFDRVLDQGTQADADVYWRTQRQKIYFLHQIGKTETCVEELQDLVSRGSEDVNEWISLLTAYQFSGETEKAMALFREAERKFPETAILSCYGGDIHAEMGRYEEAFRYWDRTLEIDPTFTDAVYAKGNCYEQLGDYRKAYETWTALADDLERRGYDAEITYPRELAKKCRAKL